MYGHLWNPQTNGFKWEFHLLHLGPLLTGDPVVSKNQQKKPGTFCVCGLLIKTVRVVVPTRLRYSNLQLRQPDRLLTCQEPYLVMPNLTIAPGRVCA